MMDFLLPDAESQRARVRMVAALGAVAVAAVPILVAAGLGNMEGDNFPGRPMMTLVGLLAGLRLGISITGWYSLPVALVAGYLLIRFYRLPAVPEHIKSLD